MDAGEVDDVIATLRTMFSGKVQALPYDWNRKSLFNTIRDLILASRGFLYMLFVVRNGPAEMTCLPGFSITPVVISDSYWALCYKMRSALSPVFSLETQITLLRQGLLRSLAESALTHGDSGLAVAAFLTSISQLHDFS